MKIHNTQDLDSTSYENYNYMTFWDGRTYENEADEIAISRLFSFIRIPHKKLIDIGSGGGRLADLYADIWEEFVLMDNSQKQISVAKNNIIKSEKAIFSVGTIENISFPESTFDTALCIRTFHYIDDPRHAIEEVYRILKPQGYFILEIPNKIHFKNRFKSLFKGKNNPYTSEESINIATNSKIKFLNHNPKTIVKLLKSSNFEIIEILSVSNFRIGFLKNIMPPIVLIKLEKMSQKTLATLWFGPSIYFLARKL